MSKTKNDPAMEAEAELYRRENLCGEILSRKQRAAIIRQAYAEKERLGRSVAKALAALYHCRFDDKPDNYPVFRHEHALLTVGDLRKAHKLEESYDNQD